MLFFDPPLFQLINASASSPAWLVPAARWASEWLPGLCLLALVIGLVLPGKDSRRHWQPSIKKALLSMALAWLICRLIRWGLPMPRPAQLGMGQQWIAHGRSSSFPSMHAAGAFALAQSLSLSLWSLRGLKGVQGEQGYPRWLPLLVWLLASAVALSRVVLGVHFPSDILAGLLVGSFSAVCVWFCAWRLALWLEQRQLRLRGAAAPLA